MKQVVSTILIVVGATLSIGAQTSPAAYTDPEAYAVYSAVLFGEWPVREAKATKLVIRLETTDYPSVGKGEMDCLVPAPAEEAIYAPVLAAYKEINKVPWLLQPKFSTTIPYDLVSRSDIDAVFGKKGVAGWKDFYAKYPKSGGINELSAVAFNSDKTIAIVYVGHSCGGLCGGGTHHILKKKDGKWVPAEWHGVTCMWAS